MTHGFAEWRRGEVLARACRGDETAPSVLVNGGVMEVGGGGEGAGVVQYDTRGGGGAPMLQICPRVREEGRGAS